MIWRLGRLVLVGVVLAVGLYFGSPYLLAGMGRYLVTEHPLGKADMILVLSGEPYLRVPEGARLYHQGLGPKVLLTNEPKARGLDDLLRSGIRFPDNQEVSLAILEALRVPRGAILTIQERSNSTRAEAESVSRFLKSHPVRKLIIVTSKSHTTRAHKIFSNGLGSGIQLIMHPVSSDPFEPTRWWQDRLNAKQVLHEYQALIDFWQLSLWKAAVGEVTASPPPVTVR